MPSNTTTNLLETTTTQRHAENAEIRPSCRSKQTPQEASLPERMQMDTSSPTGADRLCKHTSHNNLPTVLATRQQTLGHYPAPTMQLTRRTAQPRHSPNLRSQPKTNTETKQRRCEQTNRQKTNSHESGNRYSLNNYKIDLGIKVFQTQTQRATRCEPLAHRSDVHELRAGSNCNIPR